MIPIIFVDPQHLVHHEDEHGAPNSNKTTPVTNHD